MSETQGEEGRHDSIRAAAGLADYVHGLGGMAAGNPHGDRDHATFDLIAEGWAYQVTVTPRRYP